MNINQLSETRRSILLALKRDGTATIAGLSARLQMSREAVRQHLMLLEAEGWIAKHANRDSGNGGGRPYMRYSITSAGEHLFPKHYDFLTVEVLDTVAGKLGAEAFTQILAAMADSRVREWEPRLSGLGLNERIEALKAIYLDEDTFMDVENAGGRLCLIERNCPFFNVAKRRPALCSVTVTVLTRLLGYRVKREDSFQNGDGRCVFRIMTDQPVESDSVPFALES